MDSIQNMKQNLFVQAATQKHSHTKIKSQMQIHNVAVKSTTTEKMRVESWELRVESWELRNEWPWSYRTTGWRIYKEPLPPLGQMSRMANLQDHPHPLKEQTKQCERRKRTLKANKHQGNKFCMTIQNMWMHEEIMRIWMKNKRNGNNMLTQWRRRPLVLMRNPHQQQAERCTDKM